MLWTQTEGDLVVDRFFIDKVRRFCVNVMSTVLNQLPPLANGAPAFLGVCFHGE